MPIMQAIGVRELLKGTYEKMCEGYSSKDFSLPQAAYAFVGRGSMAYGSVNFLDFPSATWLVGRGEVPGDERASPYDSDILALQMNFRDRTHAALLGEIDRRIERSLYFENSVVYGASNGSLGVLRRNRFGMQMEKILGIAARKFATKTSVASQGGEKEWRYKPEMAGFLAKKIVRALDSIPGKKA